MATVPRLKSKIISTLQHFLTNTARKNVLLLATLLIAVSFILTGCSVLSGPQACIEDNFCSFDEKLSGGCSDCNPDFAVDEESWSAYFNEYDQSIDAFVCVKNKQGEHTDKVQIGWALSSKSDYRGDYEDQYVYFDAPDVQGNFQVNAGKGTIWQTSNLQFANAQEQVQCFSHRFENVGKSNYYYVNFQINGDSSVSEANLNDNYAWKYLEGTAESYPEYLIEETINNRLSHTYSNYGVEYLHLSDDREISIDVYSAEYYDNNANTDASVAIIPTSDPKQLLNTLIEETSIFDGFYKTIYEDDKLIFISAPSKYYESYVWTSGSYLIYSRASGSGESRRDIALAYLKRYVSDLQLADGPLYVNPSYFTLNDPKEIIVNEKRYTAEVVGANSDTNSIVITIGNATGSETKSVAEGETITIKDINIYARDVFITNIPVDSAAATLKFSKANNEDSDETAQSCVDSDGGLNYNISGNASISTGGESIDRCEGNKLIEAYCVDSNGPTSSVSYDCPDDCSNGACITNVYTIQAEEKDVSITVTPNKLIESTVDEFSYSYKTESTDKVWLGENIVNRTQYMAVYTTAVSNAFAIVRVADYYSDLASKNAINSWYLGTTNIQNVSVNGLTVLRYVAPYDNSRNATNYLWKSGTYVVSIQGPNTDPLSLASKYLEMYPVN